jgi:hypothetical protein
MVFLTLYRSACSVRIVVGVGVGYIDRVYDIAFLRPETRTYLILSTETRVRDRCLIGELSRGMLVDRLLRYTAREVVYCDTLHRCVAILIPDLIDRIISYRMIWYTQSYHTVSRSWVSPTVLTQMLLFTACTIRYVLGYSGQLLFHSLSS